MTPIRRNQIQARKSNGLNGLNTSPRHLQRFFAYILLFSYFAVASSFIPFVRSSNAATELWAKSNKSKKKKNSSAKVGKSGGSGFGSSKSSSKGLEGKVRSVSGHTGSGTKPLRQAANTFDDLRKEYGKECTNDVYCRSPLNDPLICWFVGKVAVKPNTSATAVQAVIAQKRLILEYAKRELRPQNLGGKYANTLELLLAPGDSEMDAVQNKISLEPVKGSAAELVDDFSVSDVGFNPEIYVGDEVQNGGLRIQRDEEGKPVKPVWEVNQSM